MWRKASPPATLPARSGSVSASLRNETVLRPSCEPERRQPPRACRRTAAVASMSSGVPPPTHQPSRPQKSSPRKRAEKRSANKKKRRSSRPAPEVDKLWEIVDILEEREIRGQLQYLVQWKDIDEATGKPYTPTWEPAANVTEDSIEAWEQKLRSNQLASEADNSSQLEPDIQESATGASIQVVEKRILEEGEEENASVTGPDGVEQDEGGQSDAKRRRIEQRSRTSVLDSQDTGDSLLTAQQDSSPSGQKSTGARVLRGIEVLLPRRAEFDPSEYQLVELSSGQNSTAQTQEQVGTEEPESASQEARLHSNRTIPDSQAVSDFTDATFRVDSQPQVHDSEPHVAEAWHHSESADIPSHQVEPLVVKPVSINFESGPYSARESRTQKNQEPSREDNSQRAAGSPSAGVSNEGADFVSQEPYDFDLDAGAPTSPTEDQQPNNQQHQDLSQPTSTSESSLESQGIASVSVSTRTVRSGISSQAAQVVPHSLSQSQGFQTQLLQSRDFSFSLYSDIGQQGEVVPETSQQPAQDSQNSSQALSELDGNSRISSSAPLSRGPDKSSGEHQAEPPGAHLGSAPSPSPPTANVNAQPSDKPRARSSTTALQSLTPIREMEGSATGTPMSARDRFRQVLENLDRRLGRTATDEPNPSATVPSATVDNSVGGLLSINPLPSDQPMVGFSEPLISPSLLVPSVEADHHHAPLGVSPHEDIPMQVPEEPLFENATGATHYHPILEQPATLDPSALTLSIENDMVDDHGAADHGPAIVDHDDHDVVSHDEHDVADVTNHMNDDSGSPSIPTDDIQPTSPGQDSSVEPAPSANGEEEDEEEMEVFEGNILPYIQSAADEYLLTLPLASNVRPEYVEIIREANADLVAFNAAFTVPPYQTPGAGLVARIDKMFSRLFDICDLPPFLDTLPVMNPEQITKHLRQTNSKFAFVGDLLELLQRAGSEKKILILARPGQIIELLNNLVSTEEYHHIQIDGGKISESTDHEHPQTVVVASTAEDLSALPTDYDVVIAFDHTFRRTQLPPRSSNVDPIPPILVLVTTSSIQHINMRISDKIEPLGRKNYLMLALYASMDEMENPDPNFHQAHQIAEIFANRIDLASDDEFYWTPQELPEAIFEHIAASSQAGGTQSNPGRSTLRLPTSRKRSLDDTDDEATTKRPKMAQPEVMTISSPVRNMPESLRGLLGDHESGDGEQTVRISVAKAKALAAKMARLEAEVQRTRTQRDEYRSLADRSKAEVDSWATSLKRIDSCYKASLRDRRDYEKERDAAVEKEQNVAARLEQTQGEVEMLKQTADKLRQDLSDARQTLLSGTPEASKMAHLGIELEERQAKITALEKKMSLMANDRDYAQGQYQQASQRALELKRENDDMRQQIIDLSRKANDNVALVNQTQSRNEVRELTRLLEEKRLIIQDRENELGRAREQLAALRNGRRETRQTSVPRSPRLGVSSPRHQIPGRTSAAASGAASRGHSPANNTFEVPGNIAAGIGSLFAGQQQGNGRYSHLRE